MTVSEEHERVTVALARLDAKIEHISEMLEYRLGRIEVDLTRTGDKADRLHTRIDEELKTADKTHDDLRDDLLKEVKLSKKRIEALELSRAKLIGLLLGVSSLGGFIGALLLLAVDLALRGGI